VFSVTNIAAATSRLVWPCVTSAATRRSVQVSPSARAGVAIAASSRLALAAHSGAPRAGEDAERPAECRAGRQLIPALALDHALDEQGPPQLERHRQPLVPGQRLLERGPGSLQVAVQPGEVTAASRRRGQRPRAPERPALFFQLPGERAREADLAEAGQGLDLVGEEPHHARFPDPRRGRRLGQAAQVTVCGRGILQ